jgi:LmbE family N-acetylglucosaminyl deacetylase
MAVLAHPDDESLGIGGTLAKYASEGIDTFVVTATRGDGGRYGTHRPGQPGHPGRPALAQIRERELRDAAQLLGVRDVAFLEYRDGELDRADPKEAIASIVEHLRRVQPDVVITFGPDGAYGHPDHIAISQLATGAIVAASEPAIAKLYYIAWPESVWAVYQTAFKKLTATVDGIERRVVPWPDWEITTVLDTRAFCGAVWEAITCHQSQMAAYEQLKNLPPEHQQAIWGAQSFYRVFSTVNGGRARETDLFEGIPR